MTESTNQRSIHHGRNVKRFREMLQMKQDVLADALGDDWNQKKISLMESKEIIEPAILEQVAKALKVPAEAIKNFNEEAALNVISNTFNDAAFINSTGTFNINPIEKLMEALEENKKLYEALLKSEREKIEMLQNQLKK